MESGIAPGMVLGMPTTKITITLPDDQVEGIRGLVAAGQAASVSAFVKHAVGVALFDAAGWREMLEEALRQTGGPLTVWGSLCAGAVVHELRQRPRVGLHGHRPLQRDRLPRRW